MSTRSQGKKTCPIKKHGNLDQRGKCWDCLQQSMKITRRALSKTLTPTQRTLLGSYDRASEAWTSAIILD